MKNLNSAIIYEGYPNRQQPSYFERSIARPLSLLTKTWSRPRATISLPYEIWKEILDHALEDLIYPYRQCNWLTFPTYHQKMEASAAADITDWKNYRIVCREFAEILRNPIRFTLSSPNSTIPEGIRLLHIRQRADMMASLLELSSSLSSSQSITTLTLDRIYPESVSSTTLLMIGRRAFPNLRSLKISGELPQDFWNRLAKAFPSLIELYIDRAPQCATSVTLRRLEILHIGYIDRNDLNLLHCPELKHLFVGHFHGWDTFLKTHATYLESVLFKCPPGLSSPLAMRSQFPNLRTYGEALPHEDSLRLPDPQSIAPLEHICIYAWCSGHWISLNGPGHISKIPGVRFITMDARALPHREANPLVKICRKRGGYFTWLPPMEHPAAEPYAVKLVRRLVKLIIDHCPEWVINVLLIPIYVLLAPFAIVFWGFIFTWMACGGRVPFAGDAI